jgi:carbonic anhydrase
MNDNTLSRRSFLRATGLGAGALALGTLGIATTGITTTHADQMTADETWAKLMAGNKRWVDLQLQRLNQTKQRREDVAQGQHPYAVVFSCIDSRVPPELVFDTGLGDLFVIRTAGHVIDEAALGSIEFGVEEFHIPLVVVLGHQKCGAVAATIDALEKHAHAPGAIDYLVKEITPAVKAVEFHAGDMLDNAVRMHTSMTAHALQKSKVLEGALKAGWLKIIGARYDLETGAVQTVAT